MDLQSIPQDVQIRETIDRAMMRVNTCIPGIIDSFDSGKQTATVIPAIRMKTYINETVEYVEMPPLVEVPIVFPFATTKGFALTLPISKGDSCLLVFSQRCIENWHSHGGIQNPEDGVGSRHHDLTDAFAIMAPASLPDALGSWEANGIEIRNKEKTSRITLKEEEISLQVAGTILLINSSGMHLTGSFDASVNVSDAKGSMEEMRGVYNDHTQPVSGGTAQAPSGKME